MKRVVLMTLLIAAPTWADSWETFPLRENGSIAVWLTTGPLPFNPEVDRDEKVVGGFYRDFLKQQGGETAVIPCEGDRIQFEASKSVVWKTTLSDSSGALDFIEALQVDRLSQGVAYAFCQLFSDRDREVLLRVRSNDGIRIWLNQTRIHDNHVARGLEQEEDRVHVSLKKGENRLLAKVDQIGGGWGLSIKLADPDGGRVEGITTRIELRAPFTNRIKSAEFKTSALVMKTPAGERQLLTAKVLSGGLKNVRCRISSRGWDKPVEAELGDLPLGEHRFEFKIPSITQSFNVTLESSTDQKEFTDIPVQKTRQWTIYLVQHVHTDIGYTRPQTEILPEHLRYIDYALDYCDLTDDYPDDAKFRWTCEITWAVREYLKRRPAVQIERLKRRVEQGRIEIAGMFLNMAEIATESSMAASLQPVRMLKHKYGLPVRTAMQNDVNGAAWCLVDYFSGIGIEFLTMGINKTRSLLPFDMPTAFWWESPGGNRVLAFRSDHYHTGNMWKIHTGDMEAFKAGLLGHLMSLENKGYPFDRLAIKYSGYHTDNSPPAMIECDLVRKWNQTYAWPKLRIATAQEFLDYVKQNHARELPVHRQAWPDWWTDGFGSAARETAASRDTHSAMQINETLLAMASSLGAEIKPGVMERVDDIQDLLLFYDEHTYGAAESISDP
ncbi:MAG: glycoside hydrolase family 38 N-terminal domain-containing protein, partial [Planctomycetota bacterium]